MLRRALARLGLGSTIAAGVLLFALLCTLYFPTSGADDTYITYWSSHALARFGQIINYNGVRLEQSSSLTLVLVLALLEKVTGLDTALLGWLVSLLCGALCVVAVACLARQVAPRFAGWAAPLLASALCFVAWGTSGMETLLCALLGVLDIIVGARYVDNEPTGTSRLEKLRPLALVGVVSLAFAGVRPEAPLVLLCVQVAGAAWALLCMRRTPSADARRRFFRSLALIGAAALATGLLVGFRKLVFGIAVPNPAAMKLGGFDPSRGLEYFRASLSQTNPVFAPVLLASLGIVGLEIWKGRASTATIRTAAFGLAATGFVVISGGDWMLFARFISPAIPVYVVLVLLAVERLSSAKKGVSALLCGSLLWVNLAAYHGVRNMGSYSETRAFIEKNASTPGYSRFSFLELMHGGHRRDAKILVPMLDAIERFGPTKERPVVVMSVQAGMVPYWVTKLHYGSVHFVDLYSLTSTELLPCVPPNKQQRSIWGIRVDMEYVLAHAEELERRCGVPRPNIVFDAARAPAYLSRYGFKVIREDKNDPPAYVAIHESLADKLPQP